MPTYRYVCVNIRDGENCEYMLAKVRMTEAEATACNHGLAMLKSNMRWVRVDPNEL